MPAVAATVTEIHQCMSVWLHNDKKTTTPTATTTITTAVAATTTRTHNDENADDNDDDDSKTPTRARTFVQPLVLLGSGLGLVCHSVLFRRERFLDL